MKSFEELEKYITESGVLRENYNSVFESCILQLEAVASKPEVIDFMCSVIAGAAERITISDIGGASNFVFDKATEAHEKYSWAVFASLIATEIIGVTFKSGTSVFIRTMSDYFKHKLTGTSYNMIVGLLMDLSRGRAEYGDGTDDDISHALAVLDEYFKDLWRLV